MNSFENNNINNISNFNKELDFDIVKTVLKKNWYWLLFIIIIGLISSFIYLRYTKPVFESKALIQRTTKDEGQHIFEFENFSQDNNLSADVELLRSPLLLEKVLINLKLKVSYFSEGEILIEEKYKLSPYHIIFIELKDSSLINKPIYVLEKEKDKLSIEFEGEKGRVMFPLIQDSVIDNQYFKLGFKINDEEKFRKDISDDKLFFKINDYKILTKHLLKKLFVNIENKDAKTIGISFRSNNQFLAKDLVKELVNTFFAYDLEKKGKSSESILNFIDSQLDTVYTDLKYSENDLQSFTKVSKSNNPELYKENLLEQIDKLRKEALDVDLEYELISGMKESVNSKDRLSVYNLIPMVIGTRFQALLENQLDKLYQLLETEEDATYKYADDHEQLKIIKISIENQIKTVNQTLKAIKNQVKIRRNGINKRVMSLESKLYGVPAKEMELAGLKRKFNLNEKYYSLLIEKRTEYEISKAGYTIDNNILQEASRPILISPNKKVIYISVLLLSILVGFIVLFIIYIRFNVISSEKELRKIMPAKVGVLGQIPTVKMTENNSMLMVHQYPKSLLSENFRHIRSNLQFVLDPHKSNVIAVSSSVSGEGKTFTSLNLAGIFTIANNKVIILDLDMRKPKVHIGFGCENRNGMSAILSKKIKWQDCTINSDLENLDFITAGGIPPNPSELILNGQLDDVLRELRDVYDIIIIDNPPIGIVSDGIKVMDNADCSLYVVRANYTKRAFIQNLNKLVAEENISELYVVLNDVELNKKNSTYGYGGYYSDIPVAGFQKKWWNKWKS